MSVTVVDHPLAGHLLAQIRSRDTGPPVFRTLSKRLALALALEAIRDLPTTEVKVETPLEVTTGRVLGDLVAVPILRAGL
ncbi:MAG: uracil phosphoribosyltransferase, partial [Actinomycetota bacterium]